MKLHLSGYFGKTFTKIGLYLKGVNILFDYYYEFFCSKSVCG